MAYKNKKYSCLWDEMRKKKQKMKSKEKFTQNIIPYD